MALRIRRARSRVAVCAAAVSMLLVLTAALLAQSSAAAAAAAAAGRTISGRVDDHGVGLVGVEVGYLDPDTGAAAVGRTAADGRFVIRVPNDPGTGFVWAGVDPRLRHVTFSAHSRSYVRAVIGLIRPTTGPGALFETLRPATPERIAGGGDVAIHLRRAAVLGGRSSAFAGFRIDLRRGDGTLVRSIRADSAGGYRSPPLAAGRYSITLLPPNAISPTAAPSVVLHGGQSVSLPASSARTATARLDVVAGTVTVPEGVSASGVRIEATQGENDRQAVTRTDRSGRYRFVGLVPGEWTILAGRNAPYTEDSSSAVHPTPDAVAESSRTIRVELGQSVAADLRLQPAAHVTGTASTEGTVVVEDRQGRIVRTSGIRSSERFDVGGLAAGAYTVVRMTRAGFTSRAVTLRAAETRDVGDLTVTRSFLTIKGSITSSTSQPPGVQITARQEGGLSGYDTAEFAVTGGATIGADGRYSIAGIVPGRYRITDLAPESPTTETVLIGSTSVMKNLTAVPRPAPVVYSGSFRTLGGPGLWYLPYSLTGPDGAVEGVGGTPQDGGFTFTGSAGVTYRWERSNSGIVLASDGSWWSIPATLEFTLPGANTTGIVVPLRVRH